MRFSFIMIFLEYNFEKLVPLAHEYQMTHISEHCVNNMLMQRLSIGRLILADKYSLTELREVCLEYVKSISLEKVKRDYLYDQMDSVTKVEILGHKLERMAKEAGDKNEAFENIKKLAESLICPYHCIGDYSIRICKCHKCDVLLQIKYLSASKGIFEIL